MLFESRWADESTAKPKKTFKLIELFAGAGGLAIAWNKKIPSLLLNEMINMFALHCVKIDRKWNVAEGDVSD